MYKEVKIYTTGSQTVRRAPHGGAVSPLGGAPVVCVRDKFILKEIWTQDYIYIDWLKYFTYHLVPVVTGSEL
jgi:hypothetical protein